MLLQALFEVLVDSAEQQKRAGARLVIHARQRPQERGQVLVLGLVKLFAEIGHYFVYVRLVHPERTEKPLLDKKNWKSAVVRPRV